MGNRTYALMMIWRPKRSLHEVIAKGLLSYMAVTVAEENGSGCVIPFHLYHDTNGACKGKALPYPYVDFDVFRIW
ncbi:MAG: hypothetical protein VKL59_06455 [Nostocaceae cyanobacterium]|nr:hypothetical protein [Nostocaceae cyanobacterium]